MINPFKLRDMATWTHETFGPGRRTGGITKHIEKELAEVRKDPADLEEWIDVIILGLDGATRCAWENARAQGFAAFSLEGAAIAVKRTLEQKVAKNQTRRYPMPASEDEPSEHVRGIND